MYEAGQHSGAGNKRSTSWHPLITLDARANSGMRRGAMQWVENDDHCKHASKRMLPSQVKA